MGILQNILRYLSLAFAAVTGFFVNLDTSLKILLVLMVLDTVSGFIRAMVKGKLTKEAAANGAGKKIMTIVVIVLTYLMTSFLDKQIALPVIVAVNGFFAYREIISIVENAAALGVPIPDILKNALEKMAPEKFGLPAPSLNPPVEEPASAPSHAAVISEEPKP